MVTSMSWSKMLFRNLGINKPYPPPQLFAGFPQHFGCMNFHPFSHETLLDGVEVRTVSRPIKFLHTKDRTLSIWTWICAQVNCHAETLCSILADFFQGRGFFCCVLPVPIIGEWLSWIFSADTEVAVAIGTVNLYLWSLLIKELCLHLVFLT